MANARSESVDALRGLAVAMVMCAHLPFSNAGFFNADSASIFPPKAISAVMAHGKLGVQLFLVISGYCIHMRWARFGQLDARVDFMAFWRRRLTRLYPPYLAAVLASFAVTFLAARFFPASLPGFSFRQLLVDLVALLLLLQNFTDASARVGNPPFWSLALEEQLYLLYFPLLALRRKRGWLFALGITLFVTLGWYAVGTFVPASYALAWYRVGPAYWFAWALGAVAAEAHVGLLHLPGVTKSIWVFLALLMGASLVTPPLQTLCVTVSFFFLLNWAIALEQSGRFGRWAAPLVYLGRISYGVYLVHNLTFVIAKRLVVGLGLPPLAVLSVRAGAGLLAGYVLYRVLEVPFLRISQRIPVRLSAPPAPEFDRSEGEIRLRTRM
jgi:peptidoglycan/LPS O-acetylase OafA/YrhL